MAESILFEIQSIVIKYIEIISTITKVSVDVIDTDYIRVAGTGIFSNIINESTSNKNNIEKRVMETAERCVIDNPRENEICRFCDKKKECIETFEIGTPIFLNREVIGVLLLVATDNKQKEILSAQLDTYLDFVDKIAYFIEAKAIEHNKLSNKNKTIDALTEIMNKIEQGVLILDKTGKIKNVNENALEQLKVSKKILEKRVFIEFTGDTINRLNEYKISIDDKNYLIMGNIYDLNIDDLGFSSVLVFQEQDFIHSNLYNLISNINTVAVEDIIGKSKATLDLKQLIIKIANSPSTILITGESGTGKEMIATAIWKASNRRNNKLISINCAAIPEMLLESELFGHVKGAFTGADTGRIGKFELANKGVLFLDEIGDMPLHLQAKLLRVLQEKEITRIGSNRQIKIDVRIIAATNRELKNLTVEKKFREDLYYRLNVIPLETTPLRNKVEDIEDLIVMFISKYSKLLNKYFDKVDKDVIDILKSYEWKGNVRELENTIEFIINMLDDTGIINKRMLPMSIINYDSHFECNEKSINTLENLERNEILKAVNIYGNSTDSKKTIAKKLGVSLSTLYRKIEKHEILK